MHEQPQCHPISAFPMLADLLDQQLEEVHTVLDALRQARSKPHVMDDYTIGRVIDSYTEQRDFIMDMVESHAFDRGIVAAVLGADASASKRDAPGRATTGGSDRKPDSWRRLRSAESSALNELKFPPILYEP